MGRFSNLAIQVHGNVVWFWSHKVIDDVRVGDRDRCDDWFTDSGMGYRKNTIII